ncbi:MAG: SMC-Scp complex subunit ScpB [Actinobacteria bacterium]|nr:SMC-Scp complex subunit ScpB [Actinomycetota bacterium]
MQDESRRALEAIIMVADHPADPAVLAQLVELSPAAVEEILVQVAESYEQENRGFRLVKVAGGWRYQSHEDCSAYVEQFVLTGQTARLSAAALETLAIVAYKQPTSRAQVAAIRGVNVDGVMRTLQQRGYIDETGRDVGPGQASLFGTTALFLERLGLNSLDELPSLGDLIPGADVVELLEQSLIGLPELAPELDEPESERQEEPKLERQAEPELEPEPVQQNGLTQAEQTEPTDSETD